MWSRRRHTSFSGELTLTYLVLYGTGCAVLDALRSDQRIVLGVLTTNQLSGLIMAIIAGLALIYRQSRQASPPPIDRLALDGKE